MERGGEVVEREDVEHRGWEAVMDTSEGKERRKGKVDRREEWRGVGGKWNVEVGGSSGVRGHRTGEMGDCDRHQRKRKRGEKSRGGEWRRAGAWEGEMK